MRIRGVHGSFLAASCLAIGALFAFPAAALPPKPKAVHPSPHAKAAPAKGKKGAPAKHVATRKGAEPGEPDDTIRRAIAGTPRVVRESPELRAMRELDLALFPSASPSAGPPWLAPGTPLVGQSDPKVLASGLPPSTPLPPLPSAVPTTDLSWLRSLAMPDLPVRWDARVVRYLEYYRTPRGRAMVASWIKKSGRYGSNIRRILREQGLPEDVLWLSLVESGFDPSIVSPVGAAGLWQFMPEGARIYGLAVDRWVDERLDPERSTLAAARYLTDLRQRFGGWELAFAAYNMGYGGLLASIRKYNTNDFWELSRVESGMPLETALYVPKIVAMAIVAKNRAAFGLENVELEPAVAFDKVTVSPGVSLQSVALAAGTTTEKLAELNPQFLANRVPPGEPKTAVTPAITVHVPVGSAPRTGKSLTDFAKSEPKLDRVVLRWGEGIDDLAARRGTTRGMLMSLNGIRRDEILRPGTVLVVPEASGNDPYSDLPPNKPIVVVPGRHFNVPGRRRLFYRVMTGDTLRNVATLFSVSLDDLSRWNALDPGAGLHDGMTLQVFAPQDSRWNDPKLPLSENARPRADAQVIDAKDAHVLEVGSSEFFAHFEGNRGRTRLEIAVRPGDTWQTVAKRYGLTVAQLERINGRGRTTPIDPGQKLVVYVDNAKVDPKHLPSDKAAKEPKEPESVVVAAKAPSAAEDGPAKEEGATKPAVHEAKVEANGEKAKAGSTGKGTSL